MLLEDDLMPSYKSAISEEDVVTFFEKFKDSAQKPSVEEVVTLLQNQNALRYFKFNTSQYCELHRLIIEEIEDANTFINFVKNESTFQKSVTDRDQFYVSFFDVLTPTLIKVCCKFSEDEVFEEVSKIVQQCVFSSKEFDCYLSDLFEKRKCPEKHSQCRAFFKFCGSLYSTQISSIGFKLLFYSFSKSYKSFEHIYKLFLIFAEMIGFEVKNEFNSSKIKYQCAEPSLNNSLIIVSELLGVITKSKVDLEHTINNIPFSDFIKNLLKSTIALTEKPNIYYYQIFLKVIEISPLIVEAINNETIYLMLSDNTNCRKEYEELLIKIFEVFSKLHRIQNFIAKMIPTLKTGIENRTANETVYAFRGITDLQPLINISYNVDDIFPKNVLNYFTSCIINLASWQVINLFKTLLFHLNKAVEELPEAQGDVVYLEILSSLTCWLLLSVRMAEHTVAPGTVAKFVTGLEELNIILGKFGSTLLQKEHNHVLMRAFLTISYYWAEMYMTLEYYSSNDEVKMTRNIDNNFSSCNLTYLHPYLSDKEWCLIAERIHNFGEKPCEEMMQKLLIQKMRALLTFCESNNEDVTIPIIRTLSSDFDANSLDIFTDRFVVNSVLDKMPTSNIIGLAEVIVKEILVGNTEIIQPHIYDSQLITNAILCVIFTKINKLLKQKRKHDDVTIKKALCARAISALPPEMFLADNIELVKISEIVISDNDEQIDLKMQDDKVRLYLDVLGKLPIIFCTESAQKLVILLLLSLHKDSTKTLKNNCESLILSIIQHSKFTLLDLFDSSVVLKFCENFDRGEELFLLIAQNVFKSEEAISSFQSGVAHIKDNLKEDKCLRFAVTTLNLLNKIQRTKISPDSKELCQKYKSEICHKMVKILKIAPEDRLVEPFALVFKTFLARDENSKLRTCLPDYVDYCFRNLSDVNIKGCLLLFTTLLHNKSIVSEFGDDFVLRIWDCMKIASMKSDILEEYSQLVILISTLIPNEQFSRIFGDLLKATAQSIELRDDKEFCKHLKTWSCILSTNLNPVKINILREQLQFLLEKLILLLNSLEYKEELFEEVIQFEVSIIQANHVPLTAAIMDFCLLTVSILLTKKSHDFIHSFNSGVTLLENLLKYRNPLIMDRLPAYLLQYRLLLKELCLKSVTLQQIEAQKVADCAHKLENLTKNLVECTKDMSRIAMYLIADILGQYEIDTLDPNVKKHLNNCIYSLISLCDQHAVQYLLRVLSNASTEIFKIMYENYKKYYRFTGKV